SELYKFLSDNFLNHIGKRSDRNGDFIIGDGIGEVGIGYDNGNVSLSQQVDQLIYIPLPVESLVIQEYDGANVVGVVQVGMAYRNDVQAERLEVVGRIGRPQVGNGTFFDLIAEVFAGQHPRRDDFFRRDLLDAQGLI